MSQEIGEGSAGLYEKLELNVSGGVRQRNLRKKGILHLDGLRK